MVFYQAGLFSSAGRDAFIDNLRNADMRFLALSVAVGIMINLVSALKWWMLVRAQSLVAGYWRIFSYYLIGQFYNLFLPTSVGGDVVRSYELGKYSGRQADSLASVFVERYTGVLTLLALAALAVLSQLSRLGQSYVLLSLLAFALALGFIAWMVIDKRIYLALQRFIGARFPAANTVFVKFQRLLDSIGQYANNPPAIVWAFINSILFYLIAVLNVWVTARVFQVDVSLLDMLAATPIIMLIMNIPLSLGNIGLMEFAYSAVLVLFGYDPALGLSVALLMRLKSLFDGAMGGLLAPIFVTQQSE